MKYLPYPKFGSTYIRIILFICILGTGFADLYGQKKAKSKVTKTISIEATVLDKDTKEPLPFTNVILEGTSIGTITNEDGVFELTVSKKHADSKVIFSFVGYQNAVIPLVDFKGANKIVYLKTASTPLDEIVVKAKNKYRELIREAITLIPKNYAQKPVHLDTYYRELTKIDSSYTRFTDAANTIYYSPYDSIFDMQKSKSAYLKFNRIEYKKNVPFPEPEDHIADARDQVKILAVRKSDNLQKYKGLDQPKTLKVIDTTDLKWLENNEIGGGPLHLTGADKIKRQMDFFNPKTNTQYHFTLNKKSAYNDKPVYIINFAPKDSTNLRAKYQGKITLDIASKAIIAYQYQLTPISKKNINQKFGTLLKTPKSVQKETKMDFITRTTSLIDYEVSVSYSSFRGKWYLKRIKTTNQYKNSGDLFDDYTAATESELIINAVRTRLVIPFTIPETFYTTFSTPLFQYDMSYNSEFWEDYSILVPTGVVGKALEDLESENSLQTQFEEKQ